ncbi:MAG: hypothetical protein RIQ33_107, partial [Bacteroidota bacterium]
MASNPSPIKIGELFFAIRKNLLRNLGLTIQGCKMQSITANNGIQLSHCNKVEIITSYIHHKKYDGIIANHLNQLIINNGHIYSNGANGILVNNANVYLRNGAVIELNVNDGININNG